MEIKRELRIPWSKAPSCASDDRNTLTRYMKKEISKKRAIFLLSHTNHCEITEEQFDANVKWLGYANKEDN